MKWPVYIYELWKSSEPKFEYSCTTERIKNWKKVCQYFLLGSKFMMPVSTLGNTDCIMWTVNWCLKRNLRQKRLRKVFRKSWLLEDRGDPALLLAPDPSFSLRHNRATAWQLWVAPVLCLKASPFTVQIRGLHFFQMTPYLDSVVILWNFTWQWFIFKSPDTLEQLKLFSLLPLCPL